MTTVSAIEFGRPAVRRQSLWRYWRGGLQGSEFTWAIAFVIPYIAVFLAFVVYPACYGLWMGSNPALYSEVFSDPIYLNTVVNTMVFLAFGVNVKLFLALMLVDKGALDDFRAAVGNSGVADFHFDSLDAERRVGTD
jgi:multiple sugar transport system permease protein